MKGLFMSTDINTSYTNSQTIVYHRSAAAQAARANASSSDKISTSSGFAADSVEISDAAKQLLEAGKVDTEQAVKSIPTPTIDSERVAEIRKSMTELLNKKRSIESGLNDVLGRLKVDQETRKSLKIEVDAKGKIVVGGIDDKALSRKIEQELNRDKRFAMNYKQYLRMDAQVSADLFKETGMSLKEFNRYAISVEAKANEAGAAEVAEDAVHLGSTPELEIGEESPDAFEEMIMRGKFAEQSALMLADPELFDIAVELGAFNGANFSSERKGVADPKQALEGLMGRAMNKVKGKFAEYNKHTADNAQTVEAEFLKKLSLDNVKITIGDDGTVSISGKFSESAEANSAAEAIVREALKEVFTEDEEFGLESAFTTAVRQMRNNHEDEFGDLMDGGNVKMVIEKGVGSAYIDSPANASNAEKNVTEEAVNFLRDATGASITAADLEVSESGTIRLTETSTFATDRNIAKALNQLNSRVSELLYKDRDPQKNEAQGPALNAAANLVDWIRELSAYRPGGLVGQRESGLEFV